MAKYFSPDGNPEIWDEGTQPEEYLTEDEWNELHPPVPYVPTKEEQLAMLDADYTNQKAMLIEQYTDAQIHGDIETATAIVGEMNDLDAWYDEEYRKIEEAE